MASFYICSLVTRSSVCGAVGRIRRRHQRVDRGPGGTRRKFDAAVQRAVRASPRAIHLLLQQRHLERHSALRAR